MLQNWSIGLGDRLDRDSRESIHFQIITYLARQLLLRLGDTVLVEELIYEPAVTAMRSKRKPLRTCGLRVASPESYRQRDRAPSGLRIGFASIDDGEQWTALHRRRAALSNPEQGMNDMTEASTTLRIRRQAIVRLHRWLGIGAAAVWFVQALTGILLTFHFEAEDALLTTQQTPTNLAAIERRIDDIVAAGGGAKVHWIWTTAGLRDRYIIFFAAADGSDHKAYIDGAGEILRDRRADEYSFLALTREIHLTLVAGRTGHWILAVAGILLVTNLVFGLVAAWPRRGGWRNAMIPRGRTGSPAGLYSRHRAIGLWAALPAIVIAGTGTLILFEEQVRLAVGAKEVSLPVNPASGTPVGFASAVRTAVAAIPGSRFVGTTLPSPQDASYYAWVRAPGELYRGGYGGSLVVVDANDGSIRGAWPAADADAATTFVGAFYPLHTGESIGLAGRILVLAVGLWLAVTIFLGVRLWWRRGRL